MFVFYLKRKCRVWCREWNTLESIQRKHRDAEADNNKGLSLHHMKLHQLKQEAQCCTCDVAVKVSVELRVLWTWPFWALTSKSASLFTSRRGNVSRVNMFDQWQLSPPPWRCGPHFAVGALQLQGLRAEGEWLPLNGNEVTQHRASVGVGFN